jgi:hypothetical protein
MTSYAAPEQVRHVVQAAGLAPSVHNTQPWQFVSRPERLELHAARGRRLDVLDADGRQLHLSCGAALFHARIAARALGLGVHTEVLPDPGNADLLARLTLVQGVPANDAEVRLTAAILDRHTHRGAFDGRPVPAEVLSVLHKAAEDEGARLDEVTGEDNLIALEVLLSRADAAEQEDEAYVAELERWVYEGEPRPDGIPVSALREAAGSSLVQRHFAADVPAVAGQPVADHPSVAVVVTDDDDPRAWLAAGQALASVLLRAADHGVQAQPLGQVTDVLAYRLGLRAALGIMGMPQLVLRMGYGTATSVTPRRTVSDVLTVAD